MGLGVWTQKGTLFSLTGLACRSSCSSSVKGLTWVGSSSKSFSSSSSSENGTICRDSTSLGVEMTWASFHAGKFEPRSDLEPKRKLEPRSDVGASPTRVSTKRRLGCRKFLSSASAEKKIVLDLHQWKHLVNRTCVPPTPTESLAPTHPHNSKLFNCEKVLFVLVCEIYFWVSCFLYSLEISPLVS